MTLEWRFSHHMRHTLLADRDPKRSVILWRTLHGKWAWAVRDMTQNPMNILARGEHRNRNTAGQQAEHAFLTCA